MKTCPIHRRFDICHLMAPAMGYRSTTEYAAAELQRENAATARRLAEIQSRNDDLTVALRLAELDSRRLR